MKELEQFTDHGGYGRRAPAWHTECASQLHFPAKNGSVPQCEHFVTEKYGMDQPLKKDIEHFMDDSNLMEELHHPKMQTLYHGNDLSIHMEEESSKLGIDLNIPTSQGSKN